MYEKVFKLQSRPFVSAPFVKHYYPTQSMSQTLAQAQLCVDRASGPVVVVGGAGTGKSLLLTMLAEKYAGQFNVVNLACARLAQRSDLLQNILFELEQPYRDMSEGELRLALIDYLKPSDLCPNGVLLLVDEAHVLDANLFDEVRLITNFVRDGQPRVRLIMAGTQGLEDALTNPKLESFNQRIAARCYLSNLSFEETVGYVRTHIDRAGGRGEDLVPDDTVRVLFEVTDGCPRLINQVCEQALMLAAVNDQSLLTEQCLQEAWRDVQNIPGAWQSQSSGSTTQNAQPEVEGEQWTVLEFGQLSDEPTENELSAFEIATEEEKTKFATAVSDNSTRTPNTVADEASVESEDDVDEIATPLVEQITEFAQRYGAAESLVTEDEIVEPLTEQIAEFQQRYGAGEATDDLGAVDGADAHDDIAIPLEAQVAELNLRSQSADALIGKDDDAFSESQTTESELVDVVPQAIDDQDLPSVEVGADESMGSDSLPTADSNPSTDESDPLVVSEAVEVSGNVQNPFDEPFEKEELLIDQFLPIVAEQNRSSLLITANELESIRPLQKNITLAELQADLLGENPINPAADRQPQLTERRAEETVPFAAISEAGQDFDLNDEGHELTAAHDESDQIETGDEDVVANDTGLSGDELMSADFVERRKTEILLSLNDEETPESNPSHEVYSDSTTTPQEPSYQDVVQAIEGRRNDLSMANSFPVVSPEEADGFDPADPESILQEMQQQHREIHDAISVDSTDEQEEHDVETSALAIEYPVAEHEGFPADDDAELPPDDRDMIIVSRVDQLSPTQPAEEAPDDLMPRHTSTGRAERKEYQKLFDQLRNVPKDD